MQQEENILKNFSDEEKGAYIAAIASIASADRSASEEELDFLEDLADTAELSDAQRQQVLAAARDMSSTDLKKHLDVLKQSELRYSLLADLMAFAKADQDYSQQEKANIDKIAWYMDIDQEQAAAIDQYVDKAVTEPAPAAGTASAPQGLFGLEEKFRNSGINMKGIMGFAGPLILGAMLSRGLGGRRRGGMGGGLLGGLAGGALAGGLGGGLMGGRNSRGGFGSLISTLNGGRGMKSTGGLFGNLFGR